MKVLIALVVIVIVLGVVWQFTRTEVYQAPEVIEKERILEVNPLDEKIKTREKELEEKYTKIRSLEAELDVLNIEEDRIASRKKEIQKELSGFMTATALGR